MRLKVVIALGWALSLLASALPSLWWASRAIERDTHGTYVDPLTGEYTLALYRLFLTWWLPLGIPVVLMGLSFRFFDRRR